MVTNPPANAGDARDVDSWVEKIPGEGSGNPLQYSCLENPMAQVLAAYSPWSCKRIGHDLVNRQ